MSSSKSEQNWKKVYENDLDYIVREVKETVKPRAMILLEGPMGAGKTTFAKSFISDDDTFSPSYSVLSETHSVLHGDFYRLKNSEEIFHLELELYLEDKNYFLVEWGKDHLRALMRELPEDFSIYSIEISVNSPKSEESEEEESQQNQQNQGASRNFKLCKIDEL